MSLSVGELNKLQGLLNYLNKGFVFEGGPPNDLILDDFTVIDSNGETVATVVYDGSATPPEYLVK